MKKIKLIIVNEREPAGSRAGSCYADLLFYKVRKDGSFTTFSSEEITEFCNSLNYFFKEKQGKILLFCEKGFILIRNYRYYWSGGAHSGAPETELFNYLNKIYHVNFNQPQRLVFLKNEKFEIPANTIFLLFLFFFDFQKSLFCLTNCFFCILKTSAVHVRGHP